MTKSRSLNSAGAGFSLVELLVAMVIGLVVTLAVTSVMIRSEAVKRTSTTLNDINQVGTYASFVLDRTIRNAGAGYARRWSEAIGCKINAVKGGTPVLPRPSAFPSPFATASLTRRLAPFLIEQGAADTGSGATSQVHGDVLTVMAGTSGMGEWPPQVRAGSVTSFDLRLANTLGLRGGDLILLADSSVSGGCIVQQVTPGFVGSSSQLLSLGGTYYSATGGTTVNLVSFGSSGNTVMAQLGNTSLNNPPQFQMFAVGDDNVLSSFDLLQTDGADAVLPVADGVVEMRALYGLDTDGDRMLDKWQDPGSGGFDYASLTDGSALAQGKLKQILAVRVGLILRTSLFEKEKVSPASLTLFADLGTGLTRTRTLSDDAQHYRFRTIDMTVPLRNMLLLP